MKPKMQGPQAEQSKNKATARLATRGNSWIFHDASFTKSWYLQGFVQTCGPTTKSVFHVEHSSIFNTSEKNYCFFSSVGQIQSHLITSHSAKFIFQLALPSDVTSVVHVTQVNMNVNIPTPPQPSDVTSVVHVTQVNMNVNIPTPSQPSDVTSVVHVTQVNMNVNIPTRELRLSLEIVRK